jgi:hypothetical protein
LIDRHGNEHVNDTSPDERADRGTAEVDTAVIGGTLLTMRGDALGIGYFLLALSVVRGAFPLYAAYLSLLFKFLEGAAAVQFYHRVLSFLQSGRLSGNPWPKVRHHLVVVFVLGIGTYLVVSIVTEGPFLVGLRYDVTLVYTLVTVAVTFLGVRWRLRVVGGDLNSAVLLGVTLGVAGAAVYDYTLAGELLVAAAGSTAYAVGFWAAALLVFRS